MLIKVLSLKNFSRNKELLNIGLFSIASFISVFGTSIYNFAISLYVLNITGSGLNFAMTLVIGALSTVIVNPFAGVLADKINKKLLAVITDTLNGMLLLVLYILTIGHPLSLSMIYLSTFILNVFSNIYGISIETAKPNLVSEKKLLQINSISKIIESSSSILGPMIGGMIFALLDIRLFIIINSFSFGISAFLQLFMDFLFNHNNEQREEEKINIFTDIIHGVTYLRSKKDIVNMFGIFIVLNFFIGLSINVPMPYIVNNILKLSSNLFGIIQGFFSMGMILGALIIRKALNKFSHQKIVKLMTNILSICMIAIGLSVIMQYKIYDNNNLYVIYFCSIMLLTGIAISLIDIAIFYELQQTIPDAIRGRVLSIGISIAKITLPIALIIAGSLINLIAAYILPIISGVGLWIFTMLYVRND
ncbi:MFS transporter [Clostridium beijerinckii]|jgi:Major Facilitator Superfamily.|uniref:MFS transporter n=2 Tax=Clostridium beijerinckii TaxID=1520 RepID=A0AAE2RQN1_CLOBE|nr:MFS transporter [Clostridium beijerinckii]ABR35615.1 major facilitator superfamily MFS_1 [Clostridium beijerinckii NCIMB 8052]AIU02735.1 major facilitator transporter [Clostridium beijerinckii ATCC 35702]MBF7809747.1 MFS transporter [Clostridium beijerinckii]NRT69474.1 MFS family permease [Clostridium beijerinckii]NRT84378.1 MFS family permease [Clostridium beijerinckii]